MPVNITEDDRFTTHIAHTLGRLADHPAKLRAALNGMALDGTLQKCGLPMAIAPIMARESVRSVRERMAELMLRRMSADGNVTRDDLQAGGFTDEQIDKCHRDAARIARLARMAI